MPLRVSSLPAYRPPHSLISQFRALIEEEHYGQVLEQAEVELWLAMQHYMYRYGKLRGAVIAFRGTAIIFVCDLTASVVVNLVLRF